MTKQKIKDHKTFDDEQAARVDAKMRARRMEEAKAQKKRQRSEARSWAFDSWMRQHGFNVTMGFFTVVISVALIGLGVQIHGKRTEAEAHVAAKTTLEAGNPCKMWLEEDL